MWRSAAFKVWLIGVALAVVASAQGSLRFEKTVPWQTGKPIDLNAVVGPVKIGKVEFSDEGRSGGSLATRIRSGGGASDTQTVLRATFEGENPVDDEWEVTFTLEFLDAKGKLIDRVSGKESWEGEAKEARIEHPILVYVAPSISKVDIKLEARLD